MRHALAPSTLPGTRHHQPRIGAVRLQVLTLQPSKLTHSGARHGRDLDQHPESPTLFMSLSDNTPNDILGQDHVSALLGVRDCCQPRFPRAPIRDTLIMLSSE